MIKRFLIPSLPLAAALVMTGCIDDNYDLSDLDTSLRVNVNDLTIPVNVGEITLNSIIDIEDSENISKEMYEGPVAELQGKQIYVFHSEGNFNSEDIHINAFHVDAPSDLEPLDIVARLTSGSMLSAKGNRLPSIEPIEYDMHGIVTDFNYHINDVDDKVKSVREVETPKVTFTTDIEIPSAFRNDMQKIEVKEMKIEFPKGLTMKDGKPARSSYGTYDPKTGIVTIPYAVVEGRTLDLTLEAQVIDLVSAGVVLKDGKFDYDGYIKVHDGGKIFLTPKAGIIPPAEFSMRTDFLLSSFDIENFTGKVDYDIDDLKFDNVKLDNLPDFLSQEETRINIANPQLYISFYNTCFNYHLGGLTSLSVTPYRKGVASKNLSMQEMIEVGYQNGEGPYKFAISPEGGNLDPVAAYKDADKLKFEDFGEVLYGDGLPDEVAVEFTDPQVTGEAVKFPLKVAGSDKGVIPGVHGSYEFRAPLALADGSVIGYSGTEGDWDSEALEDLFISDLTLTANVSSEVPMDVKFSAELIDVNGNKIGKCEADEIKANAENQELTITITPDEGQEYLTGINGVFYNASIIAPADKEYESPSDVPPISPEQTIVLKNVRAKVNGYYQHIDKED